MAADTAPPQQHIPPPFTAPHHSYDAIPPYTQTSAGKHHRVHGNTLWIGNLDTPNVNERLLYELCIQFGRVKSIALPRDGQTRLYATFAFVEYTNRTEADYALAMLNNLRVGNNVIKASHSSKASI